MASPGDPGEAIEQNCVVHSIKSRAEVEKYEYKVTRY